MLGSIVGFTEVGDLQCIDALSYRSDYPGIDVLKTPVEVPQAN